MFSLAFDSGHPKSLWAQLQTPLTLRPHRHGTTPRSTVALTLCLTTRSAAKVWHGQYISAIQDRQWSVIFLTQTRSLRQT